MARPNKKIYAVIDGKLVFLKWGSHQALAASASLGELDRVAACAVEPIGNCYRIGLPDPEGTVFYLSEPAECGAVRLTREAGEAAKLLRHDGTWETQGYVLTISEEGAAWVSRKNTDLSSRGKGTRTWEDRPAGPFVGCLYQVRDGRRFDLQLGDSRAEMVAEPRAKQRLRLAGDHFSDARNVGAILCTADEFRALACADEEALVRTGRPPSLLQGSLLMDHWKGGRVSLRTVDDRSLRVVAAGNALTLRFEKGGDDEFFDFEPEPLVASLHFWLANRSSKRVLAAADGHSEGAVTCESIKPGDSRQLWRFHNGELMAADGRVLAAGDAPSAGEGLSLVPATEGDIQIAEEKLRHRSGRLLVGQEGGEAKLVEPGAAHAHHSWVIRPYRANPMFGTDRFSSFEEQMSFHIAQHNSGRVWTLGQSGTLELKEADVSTNASQSWVFSRGYLFDVTRRHLVVLADHGLKTIAVDPGVVPSEYARCRWGLTADGRIASRDGSNWVATSVEGRLTLGPYFTEKKAFQKWTLHPAPNGAFWKLKKPRRAAVVEPFNSRGLKDEELADALKEISCNAHIGCAIALSHDVRSAAVVFPTSEGALALASGYLRTMRFECDEGYGVQAATRPLLLRHGEETMMIVVPKAGEDARRFAVLHLNQSGAPVGKTYLVGPATPGAIPEPLQHTPGAPPPTPVVNLPPSWGTWLFAILHREMRLFVRRGKLRRFEEESKFSVRAGDSIARNPSSNVGTWSFKPGTAFYHDNHLYRVGVDGSYFFWDSFHLFKDDVWTQEKAINLPCGLRVAAGAPGVAIAESGVYLLLTASDGSIWQMEWEIGSENFRNVQKLAGARASIAQHPAVALQGGSLLVAYSGRDARVHLLETDLP